MNIDLFAKYFLAFAIVFDASIAWFVLLKNSRRPINQAYFFMVFWISVWQIANYAESYLSFSSSLTYFFFSRLAFFSAVWIVSSAFYLSFIFPNKSHNFRLFKILFAIALIFSLLSATGLIVEEIVYFVPADIVDFSYGALYPLYFVYIITFFVFVFINLLRRYRREENARVKIQLQYFLLGLIVPVALGTLTNLFIPFINYVKADVYNILSASTIGPSSTVFLSGMLAYAIFRHRLMDIKVILKRSKISVALYGFLVVVVFVIVMLQNQVSQAELMPVRVRWILFVSLVLAALYWPWQRLFKHLIKRQNIDLRKYTAEEEEIFKRAANPEEFARHVAAKFCKRIPVERFVFVVYDHDAGSFRTVYPEQARQSFAVDEPWLQALQQDSRILRRTTVEEVSGERTFSAKQKKSLQKKFKQFAAEYILPLKPYDRLFGVVFVGKRIDQREFTKPDREFIAKMHQWTAASIWNVLQLQQAVRMGMEDPRAVERLRAIQSKKL